MRAYLALAGVLAATVAALSLVGIAPYDVLSVAVVWLTVAAWVAAVILHKAHTLRPNAVVDERSLVATRDAVVATLVALIGLRRLLGLEQVIPGEVASVIFVAALLAICLYPVRLLLWYYRGDFD